MGKCPEQTFLQRRHTEGPRARGKMLDVTGCQGNTDRHHSKTPPPTRPVGCNKKSDVTGAGEDVETPGPVRTAAGNVERRCHLRQPGGLSSS